MDWQRTNGSEAREWTDRATPADCTQGSDKGVAAEIMVELANTLHADPWFCMPHEASDDFVERFATLVRDGLRPDLEVYVEYSNEVWNSGFAQARYAELKGIELGLSEHAVEARLRSYAERSVEVFRIWERVFGGTDRLQRVLAAQAGWPWTGTELMDWRDAYGDADVLAVAPYFGHALGDPTTQDEVASMPLEELFDVCAGEIASTAGAAALHAANAAQRGLRLIAYEGGQHLAGYWAPRTTRR